MKLLEIFSRDMISTPEKAFRVLQRHLYGAALIAMNPKLKGHVFISKDEIKKAEKEVAKKPELYSKYLKLKREQEKRKHQK